MNRDICVTVTPPTVDRGQKTGLGMKTSQGMNLSVVATCGRARRRSGVAFKRGWV
jgi:hypothetical protein